MSNTLNLPMDEVTYEDCFLDIKYDGPSFNGVMEIRHLGNELLALHYCLSKIIKKVKKDQPEFKDLNEDEIEILVEGLLNNCFRKKLKFVLDEIEKRPQLVSIVNRSLTVFGSIVCTLIVLDAADDRLATGEIPKEVVEHIRGQNINVHDLSAAIDLLQNDKFRKQIAIPVMALARQEDSLEFQTPVFLEGDILKIDASNKQNFLKLNPDDLLDELEDENRRYDILSGRINSINLDAIKNKIGFKVDNEGSEINCSLREGLDVNDYREGYLGEWVEVEGWITYDQEQVTTIEIYSVKKSEPPLSEAQQTQIDSGSIPE